MKLLPSLLAVALFSLGAARADTTIVQKVEGAGQSSQMTMKMKDNQSRIDIPPTMSMITNKDTGDMITIMHARKAYMKIPGSAAKMLVEQMKKASPTGDTPPKLVATGKKEKINGYDTEEYTTILGNVTMNYWIAKNYPGYAAVLADMMKFQKGSLSSVTRGMVPAAEDFPGMPVRTEMQTADRKTTTTLVSVSTATIDPKDFTVPDGYTESPMPAFNMPAPAPAK